MNALKYFFLLVLSFSLIGAYSFIAAQNNQILVSGKQTLKQSDINSLIEFYEWAFESQFTNEQRENFRDYTVAEFRQDPSATRETINNIINTFPKIQAATVETQKETRKKFLEVFLSEARRNSDQNSQMLVGIYDAAHSGIVNQSNVSLNQANEMSKVPNTNLTESEDSSLAETSAGGNLSKITGKWVWGRSGSTTYTQGGAMLGSNGSRFTYQFSPNGTVEYTGIMNVMTGGCNMQVFKSSKGRATLSGTTLTINWSPASFTRDDSCSPAKNYKKTLPAESETFQVKFKDSYGQKQLCLIGKDETCFSQTN